jgi:lipopolysaccharide transport system permease protein
MRNTVDNEHWNLIITPQKSLLFFDVKALYKHYDLILLLVKRDFVSQYKQTILGPLWFFIQPVFTTIIFTCVFGRLAKISTDGSHPVLFYMAGIILWNYFADCLTKTSNTFISNQQLFGKVYFPRIVIPLSIVITNLLKLGIQLLLFIILYCYYVAVDETNINININLFLLPLLIIIVALLGLGLGMIITSLTTKYRDLTFLIGFAVQLGMYLSPVVYPLSIISPEKQWILALNPMTAVIEFFKAAFLGNGITNPIFFAYSIFFSIVIVFIGMIIFNKVEKSFIDTV